MKKTASNKLNLNRETIGELTPDSLDDVAGGNVIEPPHLCKGTLTKPTLSCNHPQLPTETKGPLGPKGPKGPTISF